MLEAPQPQADSSSPYAPQGASEPLLFETFNGINTTALRPGVDDKEIAWAENFMPLAPRNLRTMWDVSTAVATFGSNSIAFFDFVNIDQTAFCLLFKTDGSVVAIGTGNAIPVVTTIAPAGTITNPSHANVDLAGYGNRYVIIVASQTNGYFIWNGTTFYKPGDAAPDGGTMPTGISGTCVEIYAGRVWIGNKAVITFSAPGSVHDFTTGSGGGNFASSDSFLRVQFTQLRQSNGFLYLIADSSVNYISGVATSGSPPITTFTNQNLDPEIGTVWPGTVDIFNRNIIFANPFGVQIAYGGAISKVSEPLDGIFNTGSRVSINNVDPSAAKATIFGKKCWMVLINVVDPITGQQGGKLFLWNGKIWWAATQSVPLTFIQHQEINSVITAWGTDGTSLYKLFQTPSSALKKVAQSKMWDRPGGYDYYKEAVRLWGLFQYYSGDSTSLTISIDNENSSATNVSALNPLSATWENNIGAIATWTNNAAQVASWFISGSGFTVFSPAAIGQNGVLLGLTVETNAADMAIVSMKIAPQLIAYRG